MSSSVVNDAGDPLLPDFQTKLFLNRIPRFMHQLLENSGISGLYTCWERAGEKTISPEPLAFFNTME